MELYPHFPLWSAQGKFTFLHVYKHSNVLINCIILSGNLRLTEAAPCSYIPDHSQVVISLKPLWSCFRCCSQLYPYHRMLLTIKCKNYHQDHFTFVGRTFSLYAYTETACVKFIGHTEPETAPHQNVL